MARRRNTEDDSAAIEIPEPSHPIPGASTATIEPPPAPTTSGPEPEPEEMPPPVDDVLTMDIGDGDAFRTKIQDRAKAIDTHYVVLGRDLFIVIERKLYKEWGYGTPDEYLRKEVGIATRRGQRLRQIWKIFIKEFGCSQHDLSGCRYSNLLLIMTLYGIKVLTRATAKDWIARAHTLNYNELDADVTRAHAMVAEMKAAAAPLPTDAGVAPGDVSVPAGLALTKRKGFALTREEEDVLGEALAVAERIVGTPSPRPGALLAHICTEFLASRAGTADAATVPFLLARMEAALGGRIFHVQDNEVIAAIEEALAEVPDPTEAPE